MPGHYLNQCWGIVNWTLRNKLQWNFNKNTKLLIHRNANENIIYEMAAILSSWRWVTLLWRHNEHDSVSNHQPRGCLLNRLFRRRSKKTLKLRVTGLCVGNSPGPVNSPHKGPVTRKMFPFDDVIMTIYFLHYPNKRHPTALWWGWDLGQSSKSHIFPAFVKFMLCAISCFSGPYGSWFWFHLVSI